MIDGLKLTKDEGKLDHVTAHDPTWVINVCFNKKIMNQIWVNLDLDIRLIISFLGKVGVRFRPVPFVFRNQRLQFLHFTCKFYDPPMFKLAFI